MKTEQILADRAFLVERFPHCFVPKGQQKRPLHVGIHADMAKLGVLPDRRLKAFLGDYCRGPNYHEAVARGGPRYRLDGSIGGQVDEQARRQAVTVLGQIRAISRDRAELKMLRHALAGLSDLFDRNAGYATGLPFFDLACNIVREAKAWQHDPASARGPSAPAKESEEFEKPAGSGRPDLPAAPVAGDPQRYCSKEIWCAMGPGHAGECHEVPF